MELPVEFVKRMEHLLGEELPAFLASYERPPEKGVRWNPLKCTLEELKACLPFSLASSPFSPLSFQAVSPEAGGASPVSIGPVGSLPAHHSGMFYSQEPSAASAVTVLDPQPGERVLDLCAAPGGKSTQIAALLQGEGLLWSNEIVKSRANILLSNFERMGISNGVVSSCHPETLCGALRGYFDRVLVDAPCSGEGMFRKDPQALAQWTPQSPDSCAQRQRAILDSAAQALKAGGILVYSTCTFSPEENEETIQAFLAAHPDFTLEPFTAFGRPGLGGIGTRIYPMEGGEGHFVARLRRESENPCTVLPFSVPKEQPLVQEARRLWDSLFSSPQPAQLVPVGESLLIPPPQLPALTGLGVLRAGVVLCQWKESSKGKGAGSNSLPRLEPTHSLFLSRRPQECRQLLSFSPQDPALLAFLRGEEIDTPTTGFTPVALHTAITGFGKASNHRLKNRYPRGLRNVK